MRCRLQELWCLLLIQCVLLELPRSSHAAASNSKSFYSILNNLVHETWFFSEPNERRHILESSSIHNSPSMIAIVPDTFVSLIPSPSPLPALFPSDPPVTIPYSPAPGALTIPTGNCSINFTAIQTTLYQTLADCAGFFSRYVGVAICCPQLGSLLKIMQGQNYLATGLLGLNNTDAFYCFTETVENPGIDNALCNVQPANLTGGNCPVTAVTEFELLVNTSSLLQAWQKIDTLSECILRTFQNQIGNASLVLAQGNLHDVDDCKSLVLAWLASHSTPDQANSVLRFLSSCSVNQVCPLVFNNTSAVARACSSPLNETCCARLDEMVVTKLQSQMLITNEQAYKCANTLALELQSQGVTNDIYTFCDIHLSDFSLQALKTEGCLLPSRPTDINITTGNFICDLNDNILALWPAEPNTDGSGPGPLSSTSPVLGIGSSLMVIFYASTVMFLLINMV